MRLKNINNLFHYTAGSHTILYTSFECLKFHFLAIYLVEYLSVLLGKEVYMAFLLKVHILLKRKLSGVRHSNSYRFFLRMIILLCLVLLASASGSATELAEQSGVNNFTWTRTSADDPMLFSYMGDRSLRLDTNNPPHIAFGGDHLYYAHHDGSNWFFEKVDPSDGVGLFASLALDSSNRPHISYYDTIHGALKYAYFDGAVWVITTLDRYAYSIFEEINDPDAVIGSSNRYVAERQWHSFPSGLPGDSLDPNAISPISDLNGFGLYNSIDIDSCGDIHISYYDSISDNLKYARTLNGNWTILTIDFSGDVGSYSSLAVDSYGFPHISYYDQTNGNLKYASFNGTSWIIQILDEAGDTGLYTSIALGKNQRPAISYYKKISNDDGELRYASFNGSDWAYQTVDPDKLAGQYTSP